MEQLINIAEQACAQGAAQIPYFTSGDTVNVSSDSGAWRGDEQAFYGS